MVGPLLSGQVEDLEIRCAAASDLSLVSEALVEAASWLEKRGIPLWDADLVSVSRLENQIEDAAFWMFFSGGELAGILKFQLEDRLYWPDSQCCEAAYVHKLVVRRAFSGEALSSKMLRWAVEKCGELGRPYLRLDCEASRDQLRRIYENFGFKRVDDIDLDGRIMARFQLEI